MYIHVCVSQIGKKRINDSVMEKVIAEVCSLFLSEGTFFFFSVRMFLQLKSSSKAACVTCLPKDS